MQQRATAAEAPTELALEATGPGRRTSLSLSVLNRKAGGSDTRAGPAELEEGPSRPAPQAPAAGSSRSGGDGAVTGRRSGRRKAEGGGSGPQRLTEGHGTRRGSREGAQDSAPCREDGGGAGTGRGRGKSWAQSQRRRSTFEAP